MEESPAQLMPASDNDRLLGPAVESSSPPLTAYDDTMVAAFQNTHATAVATGQPTIRAVWVAMRGATPTERTGLGRIERWAIEQRCGGVLHIEMAFQMSDGTALAFTVDRHDPTKEGSGAVRAYAINRETAYPPDRYTTWQLTSFDAHERYALCNFLYRQIGKQFNYSMYTSFLPWIGDWITADMLEWEAPSYFCSQLMAAALRWVRPAQFGGVNPAKCTPGRLVAILRGNGEFTMVGSLCSLSRLDV